MRRPRHQGVGCARTSELLASPSQVNRDRCPGELAFDAASPTRPRPIRTGGRGLRPGAGPGRRRRLRGAVPPDESPARPSRARDGSDPCVSAKRSPVMVTCVPTAPEAGEKERMSGGVPPSGVTGVPPPPPPQAPSAASARAARRRWSGDVRVRSAWQGRMGSSSRESGARAGWPRLAGGGAGQDSACRAARSPAGRYAPQVRTRRRGAAGAGRAARPAPPRADMHQE